MIALGVDFAAQPHSTAACFIRWKQGEAVASSPQIGIDDEKLGSLISKADKVGIDVPLGWPEAFVKSIAAHLRGESWPGNSAYDLCYRKTDQFIKDKTGKLPLSVSTDRIGVPALRAAAFVDSLRRNEKVDRTGTGKLVEVYPAAALRRWGFSSLAKKDTPKVAAALIERTASWLHLTAGAREKCEASRDALDALIAALIARAAAMGLCEPVPGELTSAARTEGWIALPTPGSLDRLAGP